MASSNSNSGCGFFIVLALVGIVFFCIKQCFDDKSEVPPKKTDLSTITDTLSEEDKKYLDNFLQTGETPYSNVYGDNYICPREQCSGIKVTAPTNSDVVVIIKKNNENGTVCAHGYIREKHSLLFDLPDGTYQTFFYFGKGWNPNKYMREGITGGFVKDELFSKDENPQEIESCVLEYVLQLTKDGNFSTSESTPGEVF